VVCSGAKSILDLPATLEVLETQLVPVVGYQCDHFPAFYARSSGLPIPIRVDEISQVAEIANAHWMMDMSSALLLVVPPPQEDALSDEEMTYAIEKALEDAQEKGVSGGAVTPFLLDRVSELTEDRSLQANLSLLRNNALIAAEVAKAYHKDKRWEIGFGESGG
jgi:pseudouridine-5'-phosphate glycosidase